MKQKENIWIHLIWAITTIVCCFLIFGMLAWTNGPREFVIRMEMDNNTLQATENINDVQCSQESYNKIEWCHPRENYWSNWTNESSYNNFSWNDYKSITWVKVKSSE